MVWRWRMPYRGPVPNAESLGLMLQQGRLARGLSQRQLAAELGLTQRWVSEMEAGKPGKLTERLFAMLDATGVRLFAELDAPTAGAADEPAEARDEDA
jgi:HTH-type transcriptional regulator/antitoxin HipB